MSSRGYAALLDALMLATVRDGWRRAHLAAVRGRVLEVGFGSGRSLPCYPAAGWDSLTAVDLNPEMLELAAGRRLPGGQPLTVQPGDVQALPCGDGAFDTVVAAFLFCGVADPVAGLRECRRVLAPGGRLWLLEHVRSDHFLLGPALDALNVLTSRLFQDRFNQRLEPLLQAAGWRVVERRLVFLDVVRLLEAVPAEG